MADTDLDGERLWFLRGVAAALASSGQVVHYDEIPRLCRLSREQAGSYLGAARAGQRQEEPDFCANVVNEGGWHGTGLRPPGRLASRATRCAPLLARQPLAGQRGLLQ